MRYIYIDTLTYDFYDQAQLAIAGEHYYSFTLYDNFDDVENHAYMQSEYEHGIDKDPDILRGNKGIYGVINDTKNSPGVSHPPISRHVIGIIVEETSPYFNIIPISEAIMHADKSLASSDVIIRLLFELSATFIEKVINIKDYK